MTNTELAALLAEKLFGWFPPNHPETLAYRRLYKLTHSTYDDHWLSAGPEGRLQELPDITSPAVVDEILERLMSPKPSGLDLPVILETIRCGQGRKWRATAGYWSADDPDWKRAVALAAAKTMEG